MRKKIALFISSLNKGGSERVLVNLAEYFFSQGYDVVIVTQYRSDNEYEISNGIKRVLSDISKEEEGQNRGANFWKRYKKLRGVWIKEKPDLILSFIGKNNLMAIMTSRFLDIPVVVSVRGEPTEEYYSRLLRLVAKTIFHLADGVVLQTRKCLSFFPKGIQKKAVILKNSLNPAFMCDVYKGEREKRIVAVGRVDANKNHEMIIRAFAGLAQRYSEYNLTIYGEGELRQKLILLAKQLGLSERVFLPGAVSDVADAIRKAEIFVLSSYTEGMPNTLLEAMALGLCVISTDCPCGGPGEIIENGENGFLIQPGDEKALSAALQKLIDDREMMYKMGENASKVREDLNPEIINMTWKNYLDGIMNK